MTRPPSSAPLFEPVSLSVSEVRRLAERLMDELGATHVGKPLRDLGWTFGFDQALRRLGVCRGGTKRITLSGLLATTLPAPEVEDTIRHEIAHALDFVTRGRSSHDTVWKAWAVKCGAAPERCYTGDLPTDDHATYECVCPDCEHTLARHRQPALAFVCPPCRKLGRRVFLRVTNRYTGQVIWSGGAEMGPYGGTAGFSAECPNCENTTQMARLPKRPSACKACCDKYAGGRYDERFAFRYFKWQ